MNADLKKLIKSLGDGYFPKVIEETGVISIGTSLLDGSNDGIEVYACQQEDSTIILTDDGWTFANASYKYPIRHADFIHDLLKSYPKVKLYGREIGCKTKKETFVQDFYVYMSALMHLIGFFEYGDRWREWHDECCDEE